MVKRLLASLGGLMLLVAGPLHAKTVRLVYTDAQGTVIAKTDLQGTIIARYDYRPYGAPVFGGLPPGPGYTGHVNDADSGLVYMQARYYDPAVGRFLSVDPIMPIAGRVFNLNRYAYANNSPMVNIDPTGMCGENGEVSITVQAMRDTSDRCDGAMAEHADATSSNPPGRSSQSIDRGRLLTASEINAAKTIYDDKIDYSSVRVVKGKYIFTQGSNYAVTPNGNIYFPGDCGDLVGCNGKGYEGLFIHEMMHVLQYQSGVNVLWRGFLLQAGKFASFGMYNPYRYHYDPNRKFSSYNIEQQADIAVQVYYGLYPNNIDYDGVKQ